MRRVQSKKYPFYSGSEPDAYRVRSINEHMTQCLKTATFYHATTRENAFLLQQEGARRDAIGSSSGMQGGAGFNVAPTYYDALDWANTIYGFYGPKEQHPVIVQVHVPGTKIASYEEGFPTLAFVEAVAAWGIDNGYIEKSEKFMPTVKLLQLHGMTRAEWEDKDDVNVNKGGIHYTLNGAYLRSLGYDGFVTAYDALLLTNYQKLGADCFSIAEAAF